MEQENLILEYKCPNCGGFGNGLEDSWENFKRRFTFGGDTGKDQRV